MVIEVIKYEPESREIEDNTLVYKHPSQDFSCKAQLLVSPSKMALFVNEGQVIPFLEGHYTLDESNNSSFGFINKWKTRFSGGVSSFHCSVYYFNLKTFFGLKFVTNIRYFDDEYATNMELIIKGTYDVHLDNDLKDATNIKEFFERVNGTAGTFTVNDLREMFASNIQSVMSGFIHQFIKDNNLNVLTVDSARETLNQIAKDKLTALFKEYGFKLDRFAITGLVPSQESQAILDEEMAARAKARKMRVEEREKIELEALREREIGAAKAQSRAAQGYTYQQEQAYEAMKTAAGNEAMPGQFMGMGMGLGMGVGMGGAMANQFGQMANSTMAQVNTPPTNQAKCSACGTILSPGARFCPGCGAKQGATCPKCGGEIAPGAKFCPNCGANLAPATNNCPNCGNELPVGAKFCDKCGTKLG